MSTRAKVTPDGTCTRCGQVHPKCAAHNRTGKPCGKVKAKGAEVCVSHGGKAPQVRAAAEQRQLEAEATRQVATLGLPVDISPTDALLQEVQWTAGHVQWLRQQVGELERDNLAWGTTRTETEVGGTLKIDVDDGDVTGVGSVPSNKVIQTAGPSIWYELYAKERAHLVAVCSAALKAGVEERKVRLAERQGDLVVDLIRRILDGLYRALIAAGLTDEQLRDAWQAAVADVVSREIRTVQDAG